MGLGSDFGASKVLVVAGKGGVGRTTVCAAIALAAARGGASVLVVEIAAGGALARQFGTERFGFEPSVVVPPDRNHGGIRGRMITPDAALTDYLAAHGLDRIQRRSIGRGVVDVVRTAAVGLGDLLVLGKIRQLSESDAADVIVVDGPPTGQAVTLLESPTALAEAGLGGPVHDQAEKAKRFLVDERHVRLIPTAVPETTSVSEAIELAYRVEETVGIAIGPLVVNRVVVPIRGLIGSARETYLPEDAASVVRRRITRQRRQTRELGRLTDGLPIPRIELPQLPTPDLGPTDLEPLVAVVARSTAGRRG